MSRLFFALLSFLALTVAATAQNEYDRIFEDLRDKYDQEEGNEWNLEKQRDIISKAVRRNPELFKTAVFEDQIIEVLAGSADKYGKIVLFGVGYMDFLIKKDKGNNVGIACDNKWNYYSANTDWHNDDWHNQLRGTRECKDSINLNRINVVQEFIYFHRNVFAKVENMKGGYEKSKSGYRPQSWIYQTCYESVLKDDTRLYVYTLLQDGFDETSRLFDRYKIKISGRSENEKKQTERTFCYQRVTPDAYPTKYDSLVDISTHVVYLDTATVWSDGKTEGARQRELLRVMFGNYFTSSAYWASRRSINSEPESSSFNVGINKVINATAEYYNNNYVKIEKESRSTMKSYSFLGSWSLIQRDCIFYAWPSQLRDSVILAVNDSVRITNEFNQMVKSQDPDIYEAYTQRNPISPYLGEVECFLATHYRNQAVSDSSFVTCERSLDKMKTMRGSKSCDVKGMIDGLQSMQPAIKQRCKRISGESLEQRDFERTVALCNEYLERDGSDQMMLWRRGLAKAELKDGEGAKVDFMESGRRGTNALSVDSIIASAYKKSGRLDSSMVYQKKYQKVIDERRRIEEKRIINEESRSVEEAKNAAKAGANLPLEQSDVVGVWISCRRESGEAIIINGKYTYQLFNKKGVFLIAMGRTVDEAFGNLTSDIRSGRIMTGTYSISGSKVTMIDSEGTLVHDYSNQYGGFLTFKNTSGALRFHEVPSWMR